MIHLDHEDGAHFCLFPCVCLFIEVFWSILIVFISKYDELAAAVNDNELRHIHMTTIYFNYF